ncbi:response regulator transcription factor [Franconibacter pulveris 1160]|jgi:FixJ family two-component response regulator|uniref:LuxR family transcriptional regulator n=2 Tax=Franconibacter TaxID=1649295 RepID=A0A0J8YFV5_9ENTR|nr:MULTISPECIES: response regulator [Franconibacter]KMV36399.1 LuxR family transcriptional regulator [Franconibacter pulveris]MCK1966913.1 response regulator [Franconibacter sp. IITDAS19]MEB5921677.1 response regulator [Franconibacter daqui]GGD07029.1 DNA-binding response regulator [Franconibacter daqui]
MDPIVYVVDDDTSVRQSLVRLLSAEAYRVADFPSADAFLAHGFSPDPACLILDMNMPEADGFSVTEALASLGYLIPTIFLTGYGTIPLTVKAMKAGAYEFMTKPAVPNLLLKAVADALKLSETRMGETRELQTLKAHYASLTPREQEVFQLAIGGLLNKQIATALGVSEITAKVHKKRVMEKMQVRSLTDLVRAAERLNIAKTQSR